MMLRFLWLAYKVYRKAEKSGVHYCAITRHGVPQVACFVAVGRDAWRVSQIAIEEFQP